SYFRIFPSCGGASARYKSYNGPIDLRVKQREFISLVGGAAVNWLLAAERSKPSGCDRLCIARGIPTAAGNHRGRHYLTTRPCLDRRAVGSHGRPGAILVFVGRGWGQQRRSSACAITAYTMLSHGLPRLVTNWQPTTSIPALEGLLRRRMPTQQFVFFQERNSPLPERSVVGRAVCSAGKRAQLITRRPSSGRSTRTTRERIMMRWNFRTGRSCSELTCLKIRKQQCSSFRHNLLPQLKRQPRNGSRWSADLQAGQCSGRPRLGGLFCAPRNAQPVVLSEMRGVRGSDPLVFACNGS